jgi:hypothetical protein
MTSLTQICKDLGIGKPRLYATLDRLDIKPAKAGNRRILNDEQVQIIQAAITAQTDRKPTETVQDRPQTVYKPSEQTGTDSSTSELLTTLRDQVAHLKGLLANEQEERRAERQERENYQQMVMVLQGDMKQLRQQLLEPSDQSPPFSVTNPVAEPEVSADFTETTIRPETVANTGSSGRAFGMIALVILAAVAWVAITNTELPLRENIASIWR